MGTKTQKPLKYTLSKVAMSGYEGDLNHLSRQYQPHQNLSPTIFSNEVCPPLLCWYWAWLHWYALFLLLIRVVVMQTLITEFLSYLLAERELIEGMLVHPQVHCCRLWEVRFQCFHHQGVVFLRVLNESGIWLSYVEWQRMLPPLSFSSRD